MRASCLALLLIAAAQPAFASDCSKDVLAAFDKQRTSKVFRIEFSQPSAEGEVHMKIDYMPPDKMLQSVTSPAMPGEQQTMLVGNRAFAGTSGAFEELLPQYTQSIIAEFAEAVGEPKNLGAFECLGNSKIDGQEMPQRKPGHRRQSHPGQRHQHQAVPSLELALEAPRREP